MHRIPNFGLSAPSTAAVGSPAESGNVRPPAQSSGGGDTLQASEEALDFLREGGATGVAWATAAINRMDQNTEASGHQCLDLDHILAELSGAGNDAPNSTSDPIRQSVHAFSSGDSQIEQAEAELEQHISDVEGSRAQRGVI